MIVVFSSLSTYGQKVKEYCMWHRPLITGFWGSSEGLKDCSPMLWVHEPDSLGNIYANLTYQERLKEGWVCQKLFLIKFRKKRYDLYFLGNKEKCDSKYEENIDASRPWLSVEIRGRKCRAKYVQGANKWFRTWGQMN